MNTFNVGDVGLRNGQFGGWAVSPEEAEVVLIPVPWDVTVSSGEGTRDGPAAILEASPQLESLNPATGEPWTLIAMLSPSKGAPTATLYHTGVAMRERACKIIAWHESGAPPLQAPAIEDLLVTVNAACEDMVEGVRQECAPWIRKGKTVGIVGGDHSTPLGFYRALRDEGRSFGILHIDAHCDLRKDYEGFKYSHASIMRNAVDERLTQRLTQVAVRDFCKEEQDFIRAVPHPCEIMCFDARMLAQRKARGETWDAITQAILETLPQEVVVSLDIDGLEPWLCPNTGTPVPGGLGYEECFYLLERLVADGRAIIGFDVTEVAPGKLDAAVGAHVIHRLAALAAPKRAR